MTQPARPVQLPAFLTAKEVANILRIDPRTVRRRANLGTMPGARQVGRQWRFASGQILRMFTTLEKT